MVWWVPNLPFVRWSTVMVVGFPISPSLRLQASLRDHIAWRPIHQIPQDFPYDDGRFSDGNLDIEFRTGPSMAGLYSYIYIYVYYYVYIILCILYIYIYVYIYYNGPRYPSMVRNHGWDSLWFTFQFSDRLSIRKPRIFAVKKTRWLLKCLINIDNFWL